MKTKSINWFIHDTTGKYLGVVNYPTYEFLAGCEHPEMGSIVRSWQMNVAGNDFLRSEKGIWFLQSQHPTWKEEMVA